MRSYDPELAAARKLAENAVGLLRTQVERVLRGETPSAPIGALYDAANSLLAHFETQLGLTPSVAHGSAGLDPMEAYQLSEIRLAQLMRPGRRFAV